MNKDWIFLVAVIMGGIWIIHDNQRASSVMDNYTKCYQNAGKAYDVERQIIAQNVNGYTPEQQQMYYTNSSSGYASDTQLCKKLYPN